MTPTTNTPPQPDSATQSASAPSTCWAPSERRDELENEMEPVTITLRRTDWRLLAAYLEGDIESMAYNDQQKARRAVDWINLRVVKGNANKREFRSLPNKS